jgi:hypothetical protein
LAIAFERLFFVADFSTFHEHFLDILHLSAPAPMTRFSFFAREPEEAPLLANPDGNGPHTSTTPGEVPSSVKQRLYVSHFLSTWNSRVFEFGAVLYLADVFPNTLLPMSVYAFTRGAAAILFSPAVGRYIDTRDRLHVARLSIGKFMVRRSTRLVTELSSSPSAIGRGSFLRDVLVPSLWMAHVSSFDMGTFGSSRLLGLHREAVIDHELGVC